MPRVPMSTSTLLVLLSLALVGPWALASDVDVDTAVDGALADDDVCVEGESEGGCSLELRQLRAQEYSNKVTEHAAAADSAADVATEAADEGATDVSSDGTADDEEEEDAEEEARDFVQKQASTSFGPDAVGEDMWAETTWGDVVAMLQSNSSVEGEADYPSYGAYGGYHSSSYGAYGGHHVCTATTSGTCSVFSCSQSRGPTRCVAGSCKCEHGFCSKSGACYPASASSCAADTGGTCAVSRCRKSRGVTKCKSSRCLCKTGGCAWKGKCFAVTDTGGSCSLLSCSSSRGPTTCHRGRCLCKSGYVAVKGRCVLY